MGKLVRTISEDGDVMCCAIDATDAVAFAEQTHKTSAVITAALGRLLSACAMMGAMLKGERDSLTLRFAGDGPSGALIAVSDSCGNVRGYSTNAIVELPLNDAGKLDVSGAVGKEGMLSVMRDVGLKEPYVGQVPIVSGEIAQDITHYFAVSEQIPTVCSLGVLVNPDLTVAAAGGFLVQLLPGASERTIERLEKNIAAMPAVSTLIRDKITPQEIAAMALSGFSPQLLEESEMSYRCDCSRERMHRALLSLGSAQLLEMAKEGEPAELVCQFCLQKQLFSPQELREMATQRG